MNGLIPINYDNDRQTVSAKVLYDFLEYDKSQWSRWYRKNIEEDSFFSEGTDYIPLDIMSNGNETKDFQLTIEMAKELSMMARTEKGKQARQYFIELEKQWNSPEAVMARALKMADRKILSLQGTVNTLQTENKLLAGQTLEWTNRKILEAIVKAYGASIHVPDINGFQEAWKDFKKELLYNYGININLRISKAMESSGRKTKPKTLSMIHDDELSKCISTATALCMSHDVDISEIICKYKN
jgi:phage anti-repressor protein